MNTTLSFIFSRAVWGATGIFLAACDVSQPTVTLPTVGLTEDSAFSTGGSAVVAGQMASSGWWRSLGSDELNTIITKLEQDNPDVLAAFLRVIRSDINLTNVRVRSPHVTGGASVTNTTANDTTGTWSTDTSGVLNAAVSWEADLSNRIGLEADAASASLMASRLDRDALVNSLIANVSRHYIALSFTRRDIAGTHRIIDIRRASLSITSDRFERGVESTDAGSVNSARENLAAAQADLPRLELDVIRTINAIDALTAVVPTSRTSIEGTLPHRLPTLTETAGTPRQLLDRRPDVRAAAVRLQEANANIGVSVADRFPALTLGLTLRSGGADLGDILDIDNIITSIVKDLSLTIFDGGRGTRMIAIREAEAEELAQAYVSTVLTAIREVEDALAAEQLLARQSTLLQARLDAARRATQIATDRYRDGTGAYLTLLDASRSEASAETAFLAVERNRWLNRVDLMLALGGAWSSPQQG